MICFSASGQKTDLSSPESAWHSLLAALQTGDTDAVMGVCTAEGFQSLTEIISPYNEEEPFAVTFQAWGNNWVKYQIEITITINDHASLIAIYEDSSKSFLFLHTENGWKLHQWIKDF